MKGNFTVKVEGLRGGEFVKESGLTKINLDNKFYSDNSIQVNGKKYKRELDKLVDIEQVIRIDRDGQMLFYGTFDQLCSLLIKK